ncbi:unnamed protein product [Vitrella brassicaformis CCMP3155]|uniref:SbsA Ig-like domain-containing protein n=3 Tax=Vitrella brassicaformis TaxID=1169539 RepID=A0A0G4EKG3_VITBC|nr:unnamed protein product [Vitrella brassicaformis CCMP3155]|eukprot:CEL96912.1 unnamed protein product [Vitrella brassicaformis CCMP3155]
MRSGAVGLIFAAVLQLARSQQRIEAPQPSLNDIIPGNTTALSVQGLKRLTNFLPVDDRVFSRAAESGVVYIHPLPDTEDISPNTTIAISFDRPLAAEAVKGNVRVRGSKTGGHGGTLDLGDDKKTIVFESRRPFALGEAVTVTVDPFQSSRQGHRSNDIYIEGYQWSFKIAEEMPAELTERFPFIPYGAREDKDVYAPPAPAPAHPDDGRSEPHGTRGIFKTVGTVPEIMVRVPRMANSTSRGYIFTETIADPSNTIRSSLMIIDDSGQPVWVKRLPANHGWRGWSTRDLKAHPAGLLSFHSPQREGFVVLDKTYTELRVIKARGFRTNDHDVQIRDDGRVLVMGHALRHGVIGMIVQEHDSQGRVVFQWSSWDHLPNQFDDTRGMRTPNDFWDHLHPNACSWAPDGDIVISLRHTSQVVKINRRNGKVRWLLGGRSSHFTFANDHGFTYQHDARMPSPHTLTLFDNGNFHRPELSRAVEYRIDEARMVATRVWEYRNDQRTFGAATGNVQTLANGNKVVSWGGFFESFPDDAPFYTEVTRGGQKVLEMSFVNKRFQLQAYRSYRFHWEGARPKTPPQLRLTQAEDRLFYSWNGDTTTRTWRVIANGAVIDVHDKTLFEHSTVLQNGSRAGQCITYQVVALDAAGQRIRASNLVKSSACGKGSQPGGKGKGRRGQGRQETAEGKGT